MFGLFPMALGHHQQVLASVAVELTEALVVMWEVGGGWIGIFNLFSSRPLVAAVRVE